MKNSEIRISPSLDSAQLSAPAKSRVLTDSEILNLWAWLDPPRDILEFARSVLDAAHAAGPDQ